MAGPCSVESEEQVVGIAKAVKASGANMLRGGAFKPRTSPYDFQGLKTTGIELLKIARRETGGQNFFQNPIDNSGTGCYINSNDNHY